MNDIVILVASSEIFKFLQIIDLVGEDIGVPDDYSDQDMVTGMWWRHLVAGGVAGAVSRTCTAPLDRLKIFLQVKPTKVKVRPSVCFKFADMSVRTFSVR